MANRMSMFSMASDAPGGPRPGASQTSQISTTSLLNSVHSIYLNSQHFPLDSSTSLVVNTWRTEADGGLTIDHELSARAWEHARRRAEDGCVLLGSLHPSTPSVLLPFLASLPCTIPSTVYRALEALNPFLRTVTPYNTSYPRQVALSTALTMNLSGEITGVSLALAQGGIDTANGLLSIPSEAGYRAFDVFYYLLTSASTPAEREFLGLKLPSTYALLNRSGTYDPPSFLPTADDGASADDFRQALKDLGIKGPVLRSLISTLAGLLKLGNTLDYKMDSDALEETLEDISDLLEIAPEFLVHQVSTEDRKVLLGTLYEYLVDWVISKANAAIAAQITEARDGDESLDARNIHAPGSGVGNEDTVTLTIVEVPDALLGKALSMRAVFDDTQGINAELIEDGLEVQSAGSNIMKEVQQAVAEVAPELGATTDPRGRGHHYELEKKEVLLEKAVFASDDDGFLRKIISPAVEDGVGKGRSGRFDLDSILGSNRAWFLLSLHPTDEMPAKLATLSPATSAWSASAVSRQLRAWRFSEWANRRNQNLDFTADFDVEEFVQRYSPLGCKEGKDGIYSWILERGWSNGEVFVGQVRVWMREAPWWNAESMLDLTSGDSLQHDVNPFQSAFDTGYSQNGTGYFPPQLDQNPDAGQDQLPHQRNFSQGNLSQANLSQGNLTQAPVLPNFDGTAASIAPTAARGNVRKGDYGLGTRGDKDKGDIFYNEAGEFTGLMDPEMARNKKIETKETTMGRRSWVWLVWLLTFWIPSPLLRYVGRMRRPDVRFAWREKVVLCLFIVLINAFIIFWIIFFGHILCPNFDKAWNRKEVSFHTGDNDFWVSIRGKVYDISNFWREQHSDIQSLQTTATNMKPLAGLDMDEYFVPPLYLACPGLGIEKTTRLIANNTPVYPDAVHTSGYWCLYPQSVLSTETWYWDVFTPNIKKYYHGELVYDTSYVQSSGINEQHMWARYGNKIYDLTDYFNTQDLQPDVAIYEFLDTQVSDLWKNNPGQDLKSMLDSVITNSMSNQTEHARIMNSWNCIQNMFYKGATDFRKTPRCTVNNWILLAMALLLCTVILIKFISALQFGSKRLPSAQDKFVICQVPAYTEDEESLRKALDSLTSLKYDNKRKLICVICDGVIVGQGNDRPTPKIVLDILGVDPKVDPPALPFKSVGSGSDQLNFAKVYSGLYEHEGNVVPYVVIVKVGKETEQGSAKPGNRGKRDSQILMMSFLNRVHHRSPMSPLELEMYHQISNVIGVEPELYEYLFMVDADTCVSEDSLNRLVSACAYDAKIAGICGETTLQNDEKSWTTMIQVYEYFISHHLAKAFESLFGGVSCLPGCFSMYRLRTADKGKPLIISDNVVREYSVCDVDTLHKKNLLSLGEDRYLTTLMIKHFPHMTYKFVPDAQCQTAAPESWSVLLSQRRRWINSTIHNLVELIRLKHMCGFCCISMRFVVFIDLFGTMMLPATCIYIGYILYKVATHTGQFPLIVICMLAAVYGLQALVFILKRQWQHVGWMIIYILAFPIYSFVLPIYSFWNQDNFTWGSTRIVLGEKGSKQVIAVDAEGFDPRSIPLQRWEDYAQAHNLPIRRSGGPYEKQDQRYHDQYEMDEIKSMYSAGPHGSVLTSAHPRVSHILPQSPSPYGMNRQSAMGSYQDVQAGSRRQSMMSLGATNDRQRTQTPYQDFPASRPSMMNLRSQSGNRASTALGYSSGQPSPLGLDTRQSVASLDFQRGHSGPDDTTIVETIQTVLREVDLDTVTKKQLRALVEQRLRTDLVGERRTFMDRQIDRELEAM